MFGLKVSEMEHTDGGMGRLYNVILNRKEGSKLEARISIITTESACECLSLKVCICRPASTQDG